MKRTIARITLLGLVAGAVAALPARSLAQASTNKPPPAKKEATKGARKQGTTRLIGAVTEVDKSAKTLTVGAMKIEITSDTKLTKNGKPAILDDIAKGDAVQGSYRKEGDRNIGVSILIGPGAGARDGKKGESAPK